MDSIWPVWLFANGMRVPHSNKCLNFLAYDWHVNRKKGNSVGNIILFIKMIFVQPPKIVLFNDQIHNKYDRLSTSNILSIDKAYHQLTAPTRLRFAGWMCLSRRNSN